MNSIIDFASKKVVHDFRHINYEYDDDDCALWVYMDAYPRPCVTPQLVSDIRSLHRTLEINNGKIPTRDGLKEVRYHVLDSHTEGVFSLGGDLAYFLECVNSRDRIAMTNYARNCINAIFPIMVNFNLPVVTISLVRGSALGGGFEIALSGDVIIAERGTQMGFPEVLFNTFPGMGAFQSLSSRVGLHKAKQMISDGRMYSSEELYEMGIVDVLVDEHCGEQAVYAFIQNHSKHWYGNMAIQRVTDRLKNYDRNELMDICCNTWVDSIFNMNEKDIRTVSRLLRSQQRFVPRNNYLPVAEKA